MDERCETCRFATNVGMMLATCRRYPPQFQTEETVRRDGTLVDAYSVFPTVGKRDWCGEYQPAQTKGATE